jgi:hypothetical protein
VIRRGVAVWVLAISSWGCFNPSLQPGGFSCGAADGPAICPEGMSCRAGRCWPAEAARACTNGGAVVGKEVYACRGAFSAGEAGKLCARDYRPCESGAALTSLTCDVGFYAANATFCLPSDGGQPGGCDAPALLGCGQRKGLVPLESRPLGFPAALSCDEPVSGWRCGPGGLNTVEYERDQGPGGVLCCK